VQPPRDGAFNMAADEVLLASAVRESRIVLRLFRWNPWSLSLGKHQSLDGVDLNKCHQSEVMVVRRLTGGRAVLHARELTYSICIPTVSSDVGLHHDVALRVGQAIAAGLQSLGADVEWVPRGRSPLGQKLPLCFASIARGEVLWRGKKVVGSAQRVLDGVILQHGSILLDGGHEQIVQLWHKSSKIAADILTSHTATLKDILGYVPDQQQVEKSISEGFRAYFGDLNEEEFTNEETVAIGERTRSFFLGGWEDGTMDKYSGAGGCAA
jgi:lipoate-protein ligase A